MLKDAKSKKEEEIFIKLLHMKSAMHFGKKEKFGLRYIGPYDALKVVGSLAYKMAFLSSMSGVHPIFYVSMLNKYHAAIDYIICIGPWTDK